MGDSTHRVPRGRFLAGLLLAGCSVSLSTYMYETNVWAGSPSASKSATQREVVERGRALFNGKGVCHYCHGVDGYRDRQPELEADTAALIARLTPPPTDLRNPKALRLKTDKQRLRAIREGHPGTGMFPDTTMKDAEVADVLAYLAVLRSEKARGEPPPSK